MNKNAKIRNDTFDQNMDGNDTLLDDQDSSQICPPTTLNDIQIELGDVTKFNEKRRSPTMKALGDEHFRTDSCKGNQGSFTTNRPFYWLEAIRHYIDEKDMSNRCEVKRLKKDNKISIIKIRTVEGTPGEIFFSINFGTGVIVVKAQRFDQWEKTHFQELKTRINQVRTNSMADDDQTLDQVIQPLNLETSSKNSRKDTEEIWKNLEQMQNAVRNVEKSVGDMTKNFNQSLEKMKDRIDHQDNRIKDLDQRVDAKIAIFSETMDKDFTSRHTKLKGNTSKRIADIRQSQTIFQTSINETVSGITQPTEQENDLSERMRKLEAEVTLMNLDELKKDLCKLSDDMNIDSASVMVMEKNISKLQKDMNDTVQEVDAMERDLRRWKTVCQERNQDSRERYKNLTRTQEKHKETILKNSVYITEVIGQKESKTTEIDDCSMVTNSKDAEDIQLSDSVNIVDVKTPPPNKECKEQKKISGNGEEEEVKLTNSVPPTEDRYETLVDIQLSDSILLDDLTENGLPAVMEAATSSTDNTILNKSAQVLEGRRDNTTELLFLTDSNARYLDYRRLWTLRGTRFQTCYTMEDVNQLWCDGREQFDNLKYIFISVGTNDLEKKTAHELFTSKRKFVQKVSETYPGMKFILSEVTPRMDEIDARVKEVNTLLNQYVIGHENIFLTKNSNLRKPQNFFTDGKHLKHDIIPLFASNIKRALREAYGIKFEKKPHTTRDRPPPPTTTRDRPPPSMNRRRDEIQQTSIQMLQRELLQNLSRAFGLLGT